MKEKQIQTLFGKWLQENPRPSASAYELKMSKGNTLVFSAVKEHQVTALLAVKRGGLYHKISDSSIFDNTRGFRLPSKKPFDCMWLNGINAYLAVIFYKPRQPKVVYCIDIEDWVRETKTSPKKSITEKRATELAIFRVYL